MVSRHHVQAEGGRQERVVIGDYREKVLQEVESGRTEGAGDGPSANGCRLMHVESFGANSIPARVAVCRYYTSWQQPQQAPVCVRVRVCVSPYICARSSGSNMFLMPVPLLSACPPCGETTASLKQKRQEDDFSLGGVVDDINVA